MRRFPGLAVIGLMLVSAAAASGQPPAPHWIWVGEPPAAEMQARRSWDMARPCAKAELFVAADFCRAEVRLNDQALVALEPYAEPWRGDVSGLLRQGRNTLSVQAAASDRPAACAVRLEMVFPDGSAQGIVSDETWEAELVGSSAKTPARAISRGEVEPVPWLLSPEAIAINPFDDYTQWTRASGSESAAAPASFQTLPGFEITVLRAAQPDEGSWVSLAIDPRGRFVIGREDQGILRLAATPDGKDIRQVETINRDLQECRGLLFAHGALYANANNSKGLYRLRDLDGDDQFEEVQLLFASTGGVGHGRNCLAIGPDGMIYSIHGDSVDLPTSAADRTSPFREARRGSQTSEGHLLRFDPEGERCELLAAGLRNPFGIDFHADGDLFTYDADAEFDMGAPWYRPTRVDALIPGSDFGWRGVTGRWPPYFPDHPGVAPFTCDIGKGSPTAVKFGYRSQFPERYRRCLYILDWAYGRILAVHVVPRGAGYFARSETFLRGRPLNVTGLDFGPDGALYFVTGGRKTQSHLYRVRYVGQAASESPPTDQQQLRETHAGEARVRRRELESLQQPLGAAAVEQAWPYLSSPDPMLRYAAMVVIEHQPLESWQERALAERAPLAALTAMLSLVRGGSEPAHQRVLERLNQFPLAELLPTQQQLALYTYQLCLQDAEGDAGPVLQQAARQLEASYPTLTPTNRRLLRELLVKLGVPTIVPRVVAELAESTDQADHLHGLFALREARRGWTPSLRRAYFTALQQTDGYLGGQGMPGFLEKIREQALAGLSAAERQELGSLAGARRDEAGEEQLPTRPLVRSWTLADLESLETATGAGDYQHGRRLYEAALCSRCHRLGHIGRPAGPDLTSVARRFSRRDLLESILDPSKVIAENYRSQRIITTDGRVFEGRVVHAGDYRDPNLKLATNPLAPQQLVEIPKAVIESASESPVSFMPAGLLNTLTEGEILELLAFIEAGGHTDAASSATPPLPAGP